MISSGAMRSRRLRPSSTVRCISLTRRSCSIGRPAPLGTVYFHLARTNPIAALANGSVVKIGIMGAHTYVSPDWYETPDQVPTWNYMAVEGSGRVQRLDEAEFGRVSDAPVGGAGSRIWRQSRHGRPHDCSPAG